MRGFAMLGALELGASALERQTMKKIYLRLLPFCFVLYFICYLDRANIGFAALTMNKDLGLSSYIYGLGAGAFFWGYFLLEVPSNLILEKVGARRWIGRIMISWGIVSGAFAFTQGPISFFCLRFGLGLAEAGFFPGMILYFTYWFPPLHRARIVAGFMAAIPAVIFGLLCLRYLPDRPAEVAWLTSGEKGWLESEMQKEKKSVTAHRT